MSLDALCDLLTSVHKVPDDCILNKDIVIKHVEMIHEQDALVIHVDTLDEIKTPELEIAQMEELYTEQDLKDQKVVVISMN